MKSPSVPARKRIKKNTNRNKRVKPNSKSISNDNDMPAYSLLDLPSDILPQILSLLPVKYILRCKCVCKLLYHLVSSPAFSNIYRDLSTSLITIVEQTDGPSLGLVEYHKRTSELLETRFDVPGCNGDNYDCDPRSVYATCNGLVCLLKMELGKLNLFVSNPIFGEFILLPEPVDVRKNTFLSYGLGYCQWSSKYKVLRIITEYVGGNDYSNKSEIFTIGLDTNWRSVVDVNVPYSMESGVCGCPNFQEDMIAFNSGIHWFVQPVLLPFCKLVPKWGGMSYICAFDLKEEKVNAIPLPPEPLEHGCRFNLGVMLGKLCVYKNDNNYLTIWLMVDYGIESSWKKQFYFKTSFLPACVRSYRSKDVASLDQAQIMLLHHGRFIFYDLIRKETLMSFHHTYKFCGVMSFIPSFVSLSNTF